MVINWVPGAPQRLRISPQGFLDTLIPMDTTMRPQELQNTFNLHMKTDAHLRIVHGRNMIQNRNFIEIQPCTNSQLHNPTNVRLPNT